MKRGFTLVELLAILVILGVIAIISVPSVVSTNKKSQENNYKQYQNNVENAAEIYVETHSDDYSSLKTTSGTTATIKSDELIATGLIQGGLQNPCTEKKIIEDGNDVIAKNVSGTITYTYQKNSTETQKGC